MKNHNEKSVQQIKNYFFKIIGMFQALSSVSVYDADMAAKMYRVMIMAHHFLTQYANYYMDQNMLSTNLYELCKAEEFPDVFTYNIMYIVCELDNVNDPDMRKEVITGLAETLYWKTLIRFGNPRQSKAYIKLEEASKFFEE